MAKPRLVSSAKAPHYIDLDVEAFTAHARLKALGELMMLAGESDSDFDADNLPAIGEMIVQEAERARTAFRSLVDMYIEQRKGSEAANG